jgi:hypothetical protein
MYKTTVIKTLPLSFIAAAAGQARTLCSNRWPASPITYLFAGLFSTHSKEDR